MTQSATPVSKERVGVIELTMAMILSGTIGVFVVESTASSFNVVFFRCIFGAICLGSYCAFRGFFKETGFTAKSLGLAALGGVFIVFNWAFLFSAYRSTSISVATVVYHTQPFYVLLLGAIIFRDKITAGKVAWVLVAFVGVVLVTGLSVADLEGANAAYLLGVGKALLAAVFYAFATIIAKRLKGIRPHLIALTQVLVGIPLLFPFTTLSEVNNLGVKWGWLAGLGLIHTCIMYILLYSSYQKLPTPKIAVLSFTYPAVAIIFDMAVYHTRITVLQAVGIPMILIAGLGLNLGWSILPRRAAAAPDPAKSS
ncbi:DMT family transporter [Pendulispora albinea]|uniref:DMT family transporter n=1 Tax=Pendulispora albinea TaxID=2741071 RepID=A0ABZ2LVS0_9BACT